MTTGAAAAIDVDPFRRWAADHGVPLGLRTLVIEPGASRRTAEVVAGLVSHGDAEVVVLVDTVPYGPPAGQLKPALLEQLRAAGRAVRCLEVPTGHGAVHADEPTLDAVAAAARGAGVLVTVGSGTLADIGKVTAQRLAVAHVVVQTAASVNGFSDDQSVLLVSGAKRTTPSRWPDALLVDLDVLAAAPARLNRAGLGDLLSMFTAPADWLLASTVGLGRPYEDGLVGLVRPHGADLLGGAAAIGRNDPEGLGRLATLLTASGLTMGLARSTAPSSGAEHVVSHLLEMSAIARGGPFALHGEQVGVCAVVAAAVWARVRAAAPDALPRLRLPDPDRARARVFAAFGRLGAATAAECWSAYARKLRHLQADPAALAGLAERWPRLRQQLDAVLVPPHRLLEALRAAGAPTRLTDLAGVDADTARWAVANGHRMRDRFVVTDLAELMGLWGDDQVDGMLDELALLGGP